MGRDKALIQICGRSLLAQLAERMLERFGSVVVAPGTKEREEIYREVLKRELEGTEGSPGIKAVTFAVDHFPGSGPLAGLHAALTLVPSGYGFVMACDMPILSAALLDRMVTTAAQSDADLVHAAGQPFHALYHRRTAAAMEERLKAGDYRLMALISVLRTVMVEPITEEESRAFVNLNTPDELRNYLEI